MDTWQRALLVTLTGVSSQDADETRFLCRQYIHAAGRNNGIFGNSFAALASVISG
jgi:hypothetical protein